MPALTQAYEAFERPGLVVSYRANSLKLFKGAMVGVNTNGHATPMTHATAGLRFVGVANETVDNSAGVAGEKPIAITKSGAFVMRAAAGYSPVLGDVGKEVYAVSDWEVQVLAAGLTNAYKVGTIVGLETTSTGAAGVRVRIDNYSF